MVSIGKYDEQSLRRLDSVKENTRPPDPLRDTSPSLKADKGGEVLASLNNLVLALRQGCAGFWVSYDEFQDEICISSNKKRWEIIKDHNRVQMRASLEDKHNFKPISRELFRDAVLMVAHERARDSGKEWLNSLSWDGVDRVSEFARDYLRVTDTIGDLGAPVGYVEAVSHYLWSALSGRVLDPGCKADMVPVLISAEGTRKSSGVAAIAPYDEWFSKIDFSDKGDDLSRKIKGKAIAEIDELRGVKSAAKEHIKSFLTTRMDAWVPKYQEAAIQYKRRCVFVGTSNDYQFLDADGSRNRRWLPLHVSPGSLIDTDRIEADRNQLWAQGRELYHEYGVMWRKAEQLAASVVGAFSYEDVWQSRVDQWLSSPATNLIDLPHYLGKGGVQESTVGKVISDLPFTTSEALVGATGLSVDRHTPNHQHRITDILRNLGFKNQNVMLRGKRARWWVIE